MEGSVNDDINLTDRYRKFMITGFVRTLITRLISLLYIKFVVSFIDIDIQDKMIILAQSQFIIAQIALFGIGYSLAQQGITKGFSKDEFHLTAFTTGLFGVPFVLISSVLISIYAELSLIETVFFMLNVFISYIFELAIVINVCLIEVDKNVLAKALFSILNSAIVPTMFLIFDSLLGILVAWVVAMLLSSIALRSSIISMFQVKNFDMRATFQIIRFGLSLYLINVLNILFIRIDTFLLFSLFDEGETARYFWVYRIALITEELLINIIIGMFPILSKIYARNDMELFKSRVNSIFRLIFMISTFYFLSIITQSRLVIRIILSEEFLTSNFIFQILLLGTIFKVTNQIFSTCLGAQGKTWTITKATILLNIIRIITLLIFYRYGALGLAVALLVRYLTTLMIFAFLNRSIVNLKNSIPIYILFFVSFGLVYIIPQSEGIILSFSYYFLFLFLFILVTILIKPLYNHDLDFISSIIGKRFSRFLFLLEPFTRKSKQLVEV